MLIILQVVISFIVDEFKFKVIDTAKQRICPKHGKTFEHCRCKRCTLTPLPYILYITTYDALVYYNLVSLFHLSPDRKKVVEITLLPADVEQLEAGIPHHYRRRNLSHLIRTVRQIKVKNNLATNRGTIILAHIMCVVQN